jgi:hypothetical protein
MNARLARDSDIAGLVPYTTTTPPVKMSRLFAQAVYAPPEASYVHLSQLYGLVPYQRSIHAVQPALSVLYGLGVFSTGISESARSRAWTFVLDGHTFYVLDLGTEGTFLYDIDTQQWCQFITDGHNGWNLKNGLRWGTVGRILGGDENSGYVWELDPTLTTDENFRQINKLVTANITTRSRVYHAVESVRIAGSIGTLTDIAGASFSLSFSDDGGNTYQGPFIVELVEGDFSGEIAWTSLGSFMAPGRVFQFADTGGLQRIDGADVFVEDFDDNELVQKTNAEMYKRSISGTR